MTDHVISIKVDTAFTEASKMFKILNIHHLPVVDEEGGLIGIFSANDALETFSSSLITEGYLNGKSINDLVSIPEIMASNKLYTLNTDDDVRTALKIFVEQKIHAIPILENKALVGILTSNDILRRLHPDQIVV